MKYFFDSHGGLWAVCNADHPEAEPFGPRGIARPVHRPEAALAIVRRGGGFYTSAAKLGLTREAEDGWTYLEEEV